jgi:hypothetical protein
MVIPEESPNIACWQMTLTENVIAFWKTKAALWQRFPLKKTPFGIVPRSQFFSDRLAGSSTGNKLGVFLFLLFFS